MTFLAFGLPVGGEWFVILLVVVLVFGARKLPELARAMGSSITQFKKGMKDEPPQLDDNTVKDEERSDDGSDSPKGDT